MWWEPRSGAEEQLQRAVLAMRERYRQQLFDGRGTDGTSIRGVGAGSRGPAAPVPPRRLIGRAGVAIAEEWQPLVIVDAGAVGTAALAGRFPWTDLADSHQLATRATANTAVPAAKPRAIASAACRAGPTPAAGAERW